MADKVSSSGSTNGAVKIGERRRLAGRDSHASTSRPRRRELSSGGGGNTMRKLMRREIGGVMSARPPPRPDVTFCAEKFRRFKLQEEFGVHDDVGVSPSLDETKSISMVIAANDFIFAIDCGGFCTAFRQTANGSISPYKRDDGQLWPFNYHNEKVRHLFYNEIRDSIITVSAVMTSDRFQLRDIPLESIRSCDSWDDGAPLFGPDEKYFVHFDDCNNIAVVSSLLRSEPQVTPPTTVCVTNFYDMSSYKLVHSSTRDIKMVTSRPGTVIVAYNLIGGHLPIEVFSTENWRVLRKLSYSIPRACKVLQFIEVYNESILLKEKGKDMRIIDLWNHNKVNVLQQTKDKNLLVNFESYANRTLLKFSNGIVMACGSRGEQVSLLEDNNEACGNNCCHCCLDTPITRDKKYAICYSEKPRHGYYIGSINICSTFNGESIWKINPYDDVDVIIAENKGVKVHCCIDEALENVTAIFYDEERHQIYTGNRRGFIHVWSN